MKNMGRKRVRVPRLCVGLGLSCATACFRSKPASNSVRTLQETQEFSSNSCRDDFNNDGVNAGLDQYVGNKIMIVVDSSFEAEGALEWALTHTVQIQDTVILLHVAKPSKQGSNNGKDNLLAYELLHNMKILCQKRRPGVEVEITLLEGKEKGAKIVEEARQQRVSLLVIGQSKKSSIVWCLMKRWAGKRDRGAVADYCIQNASCMTIAVRRKSRKLGGYLITTKRHKNFWLLA